MFAPRHALVSLATLVVLVTALAARPAYAQTETTPPRPSSSLAGTLTVGTGNGTPWGTRTEHWLAAGLGLALGAVTVAIGTGLQRYAVDTNNHALALTTTQADAAASASTARDFLLAAEVMWTVGASLAGIALTWVIVLAFSTPAPSTAPDAATAASATLRVTPLGVTFEGVF